MPSKRTQKKRGVDGLPLLDTALGLLQSWVGNRRRACLVIANHAGLIAEESALTGRTEVRRRSSERVRIRDRAHQRALSIDERVAALGRVCYAENVIQNTRTTLAGRRARGHIRERGVTVSESRQDSSPIYESLMRITVPPTASSIGYSGQGDYSMLADGALRKRREHQVVPFVYAGAAIMSPQIFAGAPKGEFSLTRMFDAANEQERLFGLRLDGVWMHVGTPDAVAAAEEAFLESVA